MTQILKMRNHQGEEGKWLFRAEKDERFILKKIAILAFAEIGIAIVFLAATVESVFYKLFGYNKSFESSSFTIIWSVTHLVYWNLFSGEQRPPHESLARKVQDWVHWMVQL
ncbi:MAG: hypothetical protein HYZ54_13985 [Ignavibacteriae bacterium]|nr:hypothetical protein [Ignavibacteriota bacterium]